MDEKMKTPPPAIRLGRAGLIILLAGQLLPTIDFSIVNVGLDSIAQSLGASPTQLELIVAVYGVAFAVCLAMAGRLGDNLGRRNLFLWGVLIFGVASLMCGLANAVWFLLLARVLQGIGAALIVPQILATIMWGCGAVNTPGRWGCTALSAGWRLSWARCWAGC